MAVVRIFAVKGKRIVQLSQRNYLYLMRPANRAVRETVIPQLPPIGTDGIQYMVWAIL